MKYAINLFPPKKPKVMEHLGHFLAHYLRYALVLTLCIVLVVFFLRVRVDRQLADEREKLAMRKAIISATKPLRTDLENMQRKVTLVKSVLDKQDTLNTQLDYIAQVIPKQSQVQAIIVDEKHIEIQAETADFRVIQLFIARLTKDARFDKIQGSNVVKEGNKRYSFTIVLEGYKVPKATKSKS